MSAINLEPLSGEAVLALDREHIWHPYASFNTDSPLFAVNSASGVRITLHSGQELIDGMASWWSAIHGYNHPTLNQALEAQISKMSHVMFGGLTHEPAARLAKKLVDLSPEGLDKVFFSDSGSVAVEVAIKMAIQFWQSQGQPEKHRLLSLRKGYHGDTFAAMSVCDPVTGMHHLFSKVLAKQIFTDSPSCQFSTSFAESSPEEFEETYMTDIREKLEQHHKELAALILEPIVQGTGGMRFYSPDFLIRAKLLCEEYDLLLIADEIATGFGRTGKMFACEYAGISPDILCVGKALSGGYLSLAATLCTDEVAKGICQGESGVFMHGPTFMGNPLACAVANASIDLLEQSEWEENIKRISRALDTGLAPCKALSCVKDVRVLGAIGVVELNQPVDINTIQPALVARGVWLRPFGHLVYMMPPYIMTDEDIQKLTTETYNVIAQQQS